MLQILKNTWLLTISTYLARELISTIKYCTLELQCRDRFYNIIYLHKFHNFWTMMKHFGMVFCSFLISLQNIKRQYHTCL